MSGGERPKSETLAELTDTLADTLAELAVDEGPGAFVPRADLASAEAVARVHLARSTDRLAEFYQRAAKADPERKAKRKAARAARRRNR